MSRRDSPVAEETGARPSRAVLITGCSSGIGEATARRFAEDGWPVYATARRPAELGELRERGCTTLALDVTDEASMRAAMERVEADHGAVGVLVNNAGYSQSGALETLEMERVRRQFETNVFGLLRLSQLVLPAMRRQGWGRIVNVSSMGGRFTLPGAGAYHASKHAVESLSDALRFELRGFGVDVVVVEPGIIRTRFGETAAEGLEEVEEPGPYAAFNDRVARETRAAYQRGPLNALGGEAEDVARTIHRAARADRPRSRYRVTASARVMIALRRLLPDRLWDALLRSQFPPPGPEGTG